MSDLKSGTTIALICVISTALMTSAWAIEYNPGVSVEQWIKYGNIAAWGSEVPSDFNESDWMKLEVVGISGKNVTLRMSGKYKNGTAAKEYGILFNVETGLMNSTTGPEPFSFLTAGNLQQNDELPGTALTINKTESRTYLGTNRIANVINITLHMTGYLDYQYLTVYDRASGILLEMNIESASPIIPSMDYRMSFSVVDTSIFGQDVSTGLSIDPVYVVAAVIVIVLVVIITFFVLKRRKKPPSITPTTETREPKTRSRDEKKRELRSH